MPDKTVTIRLQAIVDSYTRKMAEASSATARVGMAGKTSSQQLQMMGAGTREVGANLTKFVTLPLAAAGFAAAKLSIDFEDTFAKMQGLAGVAADEVEGLKEQVLDLAGETAQAPQELAEALYFVRSAGLDGAVALEALEVSAKAAAAGLGSSQSVADALTSAINAYGDANLSAAKAGDVLVATAREGKAEASELAPQFGRLLPVASELGVTFDQVGAGLAFLSRNSGDASLSATQLDGVMQKLLKPSQQGAEALQKVGISADDMRASIRERGLLATLQELRARLGDSGFKILFDDIQGLQGALALTGQGAGQAREVFDSLAKSSGALDEAFDAASKTSGFQMRQAFAELQVAAIKLGDTILPMVAKLADALSGLVSAFAALPKPAQETLLILGGYAAIIGPVINLVGRFVEGLGRMQKRLEDGAKAGESFGKSLGRGGIAYNVGVLGGALTLGLVALNQWNSMMAASEQQGKDWADQFGKGFNVDTATFDDVNKRIGDIALTIQRIRSERSSGFAFWDADSNAQLDAATDALGGQQTQLEQVRNKAIDLATAFKIPLDEAFRLVVSRGSELEIQTDDGTTAFDAQAVAVARVTDALQQQADAIRAQTDPYFAVTNALDKNRDAQLRVAEAQKKVSTGVGEDAAERARAVSEAEEALADARRDSADKIIEAQRDVADAEQRYAESSGDNREAAMRDVERARAALEDAYESQGDSIEDAQRRVDDAYRAQADSAGGAEQAQRELNDANFDAVQSAQAVQTALYNLAIGVANGTTNIDTARAQIQTWADQGLITQTQADDAMNRLGGVTIQAQGLIDKVNTANQTGGVNVPVTTPGMPEALAAYDELAIRKKRAATAYIDALSERYGLEPVPTPEDKAAEAYIEGATQPEPAPRASGGRLSMGWNLVGENWPELIHGASQQVYPLQSSRARGFPSGLMMAHPSGGGSTVTNNGGTTFEVVNNNYGDHRRQARAIADELRAMSFLVAS